MNKFVSEAFGNIIGFLHILFVLAIIVILYVGNDIFRGDLTYPIIFSIIISIIYILNIGLISTVININNTLIKIEKKIGNTNDSSENENSNFYHKNNVSSHNQKELNVNKTVKNEYLKTIDPERKLVSVWLSDSYGQHVYLFGADNFIHYNVRNDLAVEVINYQAQNLNSKSTNIDLEIKKILSPEDYKKLNFNNFDDFRNFVRSLNLD